MAAHNMTGTHGIAVIPQLNVQQCCLMQMPLSVALV